MAFSQHGELVRDSTEHVRVDNGIERGRPKRQHATISGHDVAAGCFTTREPLRACLPQGIPRYVGGDQATTVRSGDLRSRPPAPRPNVQQNTGRGQREQIAEGLGLVECGIPVQPNLLP